MSYEYKYLQVSLRGQYTSPCIDAINGESQEGEARHRSITRFLAELSAKGWEVSSTAGLGATEVFILLRRKISE